MDFYQVPFLWQKVKRMITGQLLGLVPGQVSLGVWRVDLNGRLEGSDILNSLH